jgi:hypothetical protein
MNFALLLVRLASFAALEKMISPLLSRMLFQFYLLVLNAYGAILFQLSCSRFAILRFPPQENQIHLKFVSSLSLLSLRHNCFQLSNSSSNTFWLILAWEDPKKDFLL